MGNCFETVTKSTSEIVPSDFYKPSPAPAPAPAMVKLYGSPTSALTSYIRFALSYKPVSVSFVPSEAADFGSGDLVIQYGSEVVSGSPMTLLRHLDAKFPEPKLGRPCDETTPLVVMAVVLQHRSMTWHMERLVRWGQDLATRGGKGRGNPVMGSPRMEVKKLGRSYSELLELMVEHAQMEERVIFPILERADRGLSKAANVEHARDLPIMNGIKEDIKAIGVMDSGNLAYQEALLNLSTRLKSLQNNCNQHFQQEERELLPLMEAAELSKEEHVCVLEQCFQVMNGTHSKLFRFFIEGLLPRDGMHYMDLVSRCSDKQQVSSLFSILLSKDLSP